MVKDADYGKALKAARTELETLLKERVETDKRISRLKQTIDGLAALCDETDVSAGLPFAQEPAADFGITTGIRRILSAGMPMTATELRDALVQHGFDLNQYANEMAVIHNTIKRLQRQDEIAFIGVLAGDQPRWTLTDKGKSLASFPRGITQAIPPIARSTDPKPLRMGALANFLNPKKDEK